MCIRDRVLRWSHDLVRTFKHNHLLQTSWNILCIVSFILGPASTDHSTPGEFELDRAYKLPDAVNDDDFVNWYEFDINSNP